MEDKHSVTVKVSQYAPETEEADCDQLYGKGTWQVLHNAYLAMQKANMKRVFFPVDEEVARIY